MAESGGGLGSAGTQRPKGPSVSRPSDGPYVAPKVYRPSHSRRALRAAELADAKALERMRWVRHVLQVAPKAAPSTAYLELVAAFRNGGPLAGGHCPPRNTFLAWFARGQAAVDAGQELRVDLFRDRERTGRRPVVVEPQLMACIERLWKGGHFNSVHRLHTHLLMSHVAADGVLPGVDALRRIVAEIPVLEVAAARHGRRAAVIDHGLKATLPTESAHDVWTLDEAELPVYIRAYNPATRAEEVVKPNLVLVADHRTKVIVGYQLVPAFGGTGDGIGVRASATAIEEDITAAIWSAALRDIAPPCTQPYAGYLPRTLRMDNVSSHGEVRRMLVALGVEVPQLPAYVPNARGDIERLVRTFKESLPDLPGLTARYYIAERATEHAGGRRSRNVGVGRTSVRTAIAMADLLTIETLRPFLARVITAYHDAPHAGLGTLTPRHAYHSHLPRQDARRPGTDLLHAAARHGVVMRHAGIEVCRQRFRTVDAADMPPQGLSCQVVVDPSRRGAWWMDVTPPRFLPTVQEAARSPQMREQHLLTLATAAQASEEAEAARAAALIAVTGDPSAPARAQAAEDAAIAAGKTAKVEQRRAKRAASPRREPATTARRAPAADTQTFAATPRGFDPVPNDRPVFPGFPVPRVR